MTSERIKEIQKQTAYPNSVSVQQALLKVWNECEHDKSNIEITKQKAIDFANWLDKLSPSQKTSVWSKDGQHKGLFTMDNEQLFEKFEKQVKQVK